MTMAKGKISLAAQVTPRCERVAAQLGFELVDVETERDATGVTLRIYVDRPEGMDLDSCERFHRAIQPLVEDCDYDYLEVSSPGIDRPLKKDADFGRALGSEVEVRFFRAMDGAKELRGILADWSRETVTLEIGGQERILQRKDCALIRPAVDMTGVEEVDLSGEDDPRSETTEGGEA
jgi:ribosome maturation factor RimP